MTANKAEAVAKTLLEIGAVSLSPDQPFTWSSGLKTPIYCDNRLIMSQTQARDLIEDSLVDLIQSYHPDVEVIAGTATAGIPHAAFIADRLNLPMIYVRSSKKGHGKQNAIEGKLLEGQKVVMIEDLISTGGSVIQAADKVSQAGGQILGVVAIFTYGLASGRKAFNQVDYPLHTLTDYPALVDYAVANHDFKSQEATLKAWYQDPEAWSEKAKLANQ